MTTDGNLLKRAEMVGITQAALARAAGLHPQTVGRLADERPRGPVRDSLQRAEAALTEREQEVLAHLLPLHIDHVVDDVAALLRQRGYEVRR